MDPSAIFALVGHSRKPQLCLLRISAQSAAMVSKNCPNHTWCLENVAKKWEWCELRRQHDLLSAEIEHRPHPLVGVELGGIEGRRIVRAIAAVCGHVEVHADEVAAAAAAGVSRCDGDAG